MDDSAAGFTDDEINQISTHVLPEALWDLDNALYGQHGYHQTNHENSTLSHSYPGPSSSSYLPYDNCLFSVHPTLAPSSSTSPNLLSFGYGNQLTTAAKVESKTQLAGDSAHFVSHGGYDYSHTPDLSYAVGATAASASAPSTNSAGGNRGASTGSGGVSQARAEAAPTKTPAAALDHILAERKRREKLSQRFIALSAIVPGLKKTDKASVLGDAIEYMKQLQGRVQSLEEQAAKQATNSAVVVKKSHFPVDDDGIAPSDDNSDCPFVAAMDSSLTEVEVKVMDQTVLLRIHCAHRKAMLVKILAEVERFGLSVVNSSVMPFTDSVLDITIIAQMEEGFCMQVKELVRDLHSAITQLM